MSFYVILHLTTS